MLLIIINSNLCSLNKLYLLFICSLLSIPLFTFKTLCNLVGPTGNNPVIDPLAVLHLDNWLYFMVYRTTMCTSKNILISQMSGLEMKKFNIWKDLFSFFISGEFEQVTADAKKVSHFVEKKLFWQSCTRCNKSNRLSHISAVMTKHKTIQNTN